jgi:drug/metabolite transporter (DMT)-like permease
MSCGALLFALIGADTPGSLKSAWRLQFMAVIQFPFMLLELRRSSTDVIARWKQNFALLAVTGALSALNYSAFTVALDFTSINNAMIIANSAPAWFVLTATVLFCALRAGRCRYLLIAPVGVSQSATQSRDTVAASVSTSAAAVATDSKARSGSSPATANHTCDADGEDASLLIEHAALGSTDETTCANSSSHSENVPAVDASVVNAGAENQVTGESESCGGETAPVDHHEPAFSPESLACLHPSAATHAHAVLTWFYGQQGPMAATLFEAVGAGVGFAGVVWLVFSKERDGAAAMSSSRLGEPRQPGALGNLLAVIASLSFCLYLAVGSRLRQWMPTMMYSAPMTFVAAVLSTVAAALFDTRVTMSGTGPASVLGWAGDRYRFSAVLMSAVIPGLFGHTLANFAMSVVSPLAMSSMNLSGPFIGTCIAWSVGAQGAPSWSTWLAGVVVIAGAGLVIIGDRSQAGVRATVWARAQSCLSCSQ